VTTPVHLARAELKLVQLQAAFEARLPFPNTIVTNDRREAQNFASRFAHVIAKPIRYGLVATQPKPRMAWTTEVSVAELGALVGPPVILQERIAAKRHLRVVTVGQQTFASAVDTNDCDWRMTVENHERFYRVPHHDFPSLFGMAQTMARSLGLGVSAQDWVIHAERGPLFLEANPVGQWLFLEEAHHGAIGNALVQLLELLAGLARASDEGHA
jgi:glutathione synthase/RimK-type ligase-like ATP-grasp enzyme